MNAVKTTIQNRWGHLFVLLLAVQAGLGAQEPGAREVIDRMEESLRGETMEARMRMEVERDRYNRTMVMEIWDDSKADKSFIRILRPKKDRGITFLKSGDNLWQYIPSIGKEIKIEGSMMQDSWMGSDFTNDDLMKASSIVDDYTHRFISSESDDVYHIEMKPKPQAPVVWNRVVVEVRKSDYLPKRQEYYDHKGRLQKVMKYSDYRVMDGQKIPTVYEMETIENGRVDSETKMVFEKARFNHNINPRIFSKANMRR